MHTTRVSLLTKLNAKNDPQAWREFSLIYQPFIVNWLKSYPLQAADVDDLTQEIMLYLVENINSFEHNGQIGAFRNWLRAVTLNICRNYLRKIKPNFQQNLTHLTLLLEQLEDPHSNQSYLLNLAHDRVIVQILLENLAEHFQADTIKIFKLHVIEEIPAVDVAATMNVSVAVVHVAKSRVLRRLRQDAEGWLDDLKLALK
jgi:RNA polymerase sigma-70 factor (ECF subfamily)